MEQGWRKLRFDKNHVSCTRPFCRPPEDNICGTDRRHVKEEILATELGSSICSLMCASASFGNGCRPPSRPACQPQGFSVLHSREQVVLVRRGIQDSRRHHNTPRTDTHSVGLPRMGRQAETRPAPRRAVDRDTYFSTYIVHYIWHLPEERYSFHRASIVFCLCVRGISDSQARWPRLEHLPDLQQCRTKIL